VTIDELWAEVGAVLREARGRVQPGAFYQQHKKEGAPAADTIVAIERGDPGHARKLDAYASALGINLVDVIEVVLARRREAQPLSARALLIARAWDEGRNLELRENVWMLARVLATQSRDSPLWTEAPPATGTAKTDKRAKRVVRPK